MNYTIIRSNRKTMSINITKDATVEIRAPIRTKISDINNFIYANEKWISKHLALRKQRNENKSKFFLNYGDKILYRGNEYPIYQKTGNNIGFDNNCFYIPENLNSDEIKHAIIQTYKMLAKIVIKDKVAYYADKMITTPTAIKINSAKTRWGSCSGKNSINFSWRLIMANDGVIDYVVVHELAHTKQHNHSENFWEIVAQFIPDYKEREKELKLLSKRINNENWD